MTATMRVAHLTSVHPADDVRIYHKECRSLAAAGYEVHLVAPTDRRALEGITLESLPPPRGRRRRFTSTVWGVYRAAVRLNARVYHFHDAELIPVGLLLRARGKNVIYDVHENLAATVLTRVWIPRIARRPVAWVARLAEWIAARALSGVVVATPAIARQFPASRTVLVQNFPLRSELEASGPPYADRPANVVYAGGISVIRGAREMVAAAGKVAARRPVKLMLVGSMPERLRSELAEAPGWRATDYLGWQPRTEMVRLLGSARAGLVLFHPAPNHVAAQPNKLFEYMSASLPVVASDFPLWREIVSGVGCGLVVDPLDIEAIADAVDWLLAHPEDAEAMGRRGLEAVRSRFNWDAEAAHLLQHYERYV